MGEINKVVVRYADGRVLKGTTQDFLANRPRFHLLPAEGGAAVEVRCREVKAVFFVKDFAGHPERVDEAGFLAGPRETNQGKKIAVRFRDGELVCGYTLSFLPGRDGFFMFPADAEGNNLRIYVVAAAVAEVKAGPAADQLVEKTLRARRAA